jgi:trans-aconitate 2-methyltransferase
VSDWNPESYALFGDLRLRPALDLLAQVGDVPDGPVVDLGCGAGSVAHALSQRFAGRLTGVDASPAMLAEAEATGLYQSLIAEDVGLWRPEVAPALIFSNAVLQWLEDHPRLMPRLASYLMPGGSLAVQMPRQFRAPSHRFLRDIAAAMFPDRFDFSGWQPPVETAETYARWLAPLGRVSAWQSDYVQRLWLEEGSTAHPVRRFTESTVMRPFLQKLTEGEATAFVMAYEEALAVAYPALADGSVMMPFRRVFFVLTV